MNKLFLGKPSQKIIDFIKSKTKDYTHDGKWTMYLYTDQEMTIPYSVKPTIICDYFDDVDNYPYAMWIDIETFEESEKLHYVDLNLETSTWEFNVDSLTAAEEQYGIHLYDAKAPRNATQLKGDITNLTTYDKYYVKMEWSKS